MPTAGPVNGCGRHARIRHRSHAALYDVISRLVSETGYVEIHRMFDVAGNLHMNFYEDWNNAANVASSLHDVERFLDKLEPLASPALKPHWRTL